MNPKMLRKLHRNDKIAAYLIKAGGISIILSMIVMIVLLVKVAMPLFFKADVELLRTWSRPAGAGVMGIDDYGETYYQLSEDGVLNFYNIRDQITIGDPVPLVSNGMDFTAKRTETHEICIHIEGEIQVYMVVFTARFDHDGVRRIDHEVQHLITFESQSKGIFNPFEVFFSEEKSALMERVNPGTLALTVVSKEEDMFGELEETVETYYWSDSQAPVAPGQYMDGNGASPLSSFVIGENGTSFWVGTQSGKLLLLAIREGRWVTLDHVTLGDGLAIQHVTAVFGRVSAAVTLENGQCSTFMVIGGKIRKTHQLTKNPGPVRKVFASQRHKNLVFLQDQRLFSIHMTSEKSLFNFRTPASLRNLILTERGDLLSGVDESGQIWMWRINSPHPEISFKSLWLKVWYESYREPSFTWQSSSANDDFEPKLSLMPLVFGSLKGTFYGMLFALPLAIAGALYTSQIMRPKWKKIIKPVIELMAAVPTVIVGFLAALWLAPVIERNLAGVFFLPVLIPLSVVIGGKLVASYKKRSEYEGTEFVWILPFILLGATMAVQFGHLAETWIFSGDLKLWVFEQFQTQVDQRNSIVISFALGFAVIPVIFTISEDAMSNVPKGMVASSLALGANPWQTVRRVVLPMASPGIFAAVMIGFGRAVGETMIVLMATGNTPIMDGSIFNGMRTLAANIAVEIPEAPVDGSLYRLLFLSALLLFLLTFLVNTLAEFVRSRLRRKYGQY